jgi:hypothetical protein
MNSNSTKRAVRKNGENKRMRQLVEGPSEIVRRHLSKEACKKHSQTEKSYKQAVIFSSFSSCRLRNEFIIIVSLFVGLLVPRLRAERGHPKERRKTLFSFDEFNFLLL